MSGADVLGGGSEAHGLEPGFKRSGAAWEVARAPAKPPSGRALEAPRSGLTWLLGLSAAGWLKRPATERTAVPARGRFESLAEARARYSRPMAARRWSEHPWPQLAPPNVRAKLPAEAGFVSPVRDDSTTDADRAYKACRSGSA